MKHKFGGVESCWGVAFPNPAYMKKPMYQIGTLVFYIQLLFTAVAFFTFHVLLKRKQPPKIALQSCRQFLAICAKRRNFEFSANFFIMYPEICLKNVRCSTALYMRLSRDDENFGDSVSIETQRIVSHKFAQENGLIVYDEYVDDGRSGTNFERPAFQRMMEDIEEGKVNCVVTKDYCAIIGLNQKDPKGL